VDEVLHEKVEDVSMRHPEEILMNALENVPRCTLVAQIRAVEVPLGA
jgi:hypothetical protein